MESDILNRVTLQYQISLSLCVRKCKIKSIECPLTKDRSGWLTQDRIPRRKTNQLRAYPWEGIINPLQGLTLQSI